MGTRRGRGTREFILEITARRRKSLVEIRGEGQEEVEEEQRQKGARKSDRADPYPRGKNEVEERGISIVISIGR